LSSVGGYGKFDAEVKSLLKGNRNPKTFQINLNNIQTRIFYRPSQMRIGACLPISTGPNDRTNIIIFMDPWKLLLRFE
jgi:hypothetical protein